ncbi:MAG: DoxX family protein [Ignavibacteriales bacterium]|nr:DoxX family protein [Ignavibacteriales bacterium]
METNTPIRDYTVLILRILLGSLFVFSGSAKLFNLNEFAKSIIEFGFTWGSFPYILSVLITLIELIAGVCLVLGLWIKMTSGVLMGLLLLFIAVIIPQIAVGNVIDCGCFGPLADSKVDVTLIIRDVFLSILTFILFNQNKSRFSLDSLIVKGVA